MPVMINETSHFSLSPGGATTTTVAADKHFSEWSSRCQKFTTGSAYKCMVVSQRTAVSCCERMLMSWDKIMCTVELWTHGINGSRTVSIVRVRKNPNLHGCSKLVYRFDSYQQGSCKGLKVWHIEWVLQFGLGPWDVQTKYMYSCSDDDPAVVELQP